MGGKRNGVPSNRGRVARSGFVDRLIADSHHLIHRLKAKDSTGRWACYYIYVPASKEVGYLNALKGKDTFDLKTYGKVLASNYGKLPNAETREILRNKYGLDV